MTDDIVTKVREFILDNLLFGDASRMPDDDASLLATGTIDSTGVLELIEFLEATFQIKIEDTETTPDNLDGVGRIAAFVRRKQTASAQ